MTRQLAHLHIETGPGGWLKAFWRRGAEAENTIYARFRPPQKKHDWWALTALQAPKNSRLHTALLDDVPRHVIERAVNASEVFKDGLRERLDAAIPYELDAEFRRAYKEAPRLKLERPSQHRLDDAFFGDVAHAYRQAVAAGLPPLKTMAEDSGIPQGTIARWVAKAREPELGFLPPAEPGKVSA